MSSLSSNLSKLEKEKQKLIQEKCQALLNEMLRDEDNKYCVDCDAKGPRWASWNLGIFLCIRCAGIHRNLGVHISRVKSVNLDTWTPEQVVTMQQMGNSRGRAVYEANLPDTFRRPQIDSALESFIRAKYEHHKYIAKEWVKPEPPKVNWDSEIEENLRKKKEAKKHHGSSNDIGPLPAPKSTTDRSTASSKKVVHTPVTAEKKQSQQVPTVKPLPVTVPSPNVVAASSANDDLLGLSLGGDTNVGPSTPAATTNQNDLGSIFITPEGSGITDPSGSLTASGQKMTKESILSLYGSSGSTPVGLNINPFLNPYPQNQPAMFGNSPNVNSLVGQFGTPSPANIPGSAGSSDFLFGSQAQPQGPVTPQVQDPLQNQFLGLNLGNSNPYAPPVQNNATSPYGMGMPNMNMIPNGMNNSNGMGMQPGVQGLGNYMGMNLNMGLGTPGFNKVPTSNLPGLGTSVNQLLMKPNGPSPAPQATTLAGNLWK